MTSTTPAASERPPTRVCVVGAGVVGLTSAVALRLLAPDPKLAHLARVDSVSSHLRRPPPDTDVTIVAHHASPDTTSDGAGALWRPIMAGATPADTLRRWGRLTLAWFFGIIGARMGPEAGIALCPGYEFFASREEAHRPDWADDVPSFREATSAECGRRKAACGWRYTSVMINAPVYLAWLHALATRLGVKVQIGRRVRAFTRAELGGEYDVVVNCTGIGAPEVVRGGDTSVVPVRGQVAVVRAPRVSMFCVDHRELTYVLPRPYSDGYCVCGGTAIEGDGTTHIDDATAKDILRRCSAMVPATAGAEVVRHWAGSRPTRKLGIRVEMEGAWDGGGGVSAAEAEGGTASAAAAERAAHTLAVVHNYGHGGCGHTVHWGCAVDVARLVRSFVDSGDGGGGGGLPVITGGEVDVSGGGVSGIVSATVAARLAAVGPLMTRGEGSGGHTRPRRSKL